MINMKTNELGQYIPIHYHFQMLSDEFRMKAFKSAIEKVVNPGDTVVELGSGTGVMSSFAAKQGAKVFSIEFNPTLASASKQFIKDNSLNDKITVINADASTWLPDRPADVVICEMLHSALLREKQVQVIESFRKGHFNKFGTIPIMIPSATILGIQPVYQEYNFHGFNAAIPLFQNPYCQTPDCFSEQEPMVYEIVDYSNSEEKEYKANLTYFFKNKATINAIRFITKSILSMDRLSGNVIDWHSQHLIIPLDKTYNMSIGQSMNVKFSYIPGTSIEELNNSIKTRIISLSSKSDLTLTA